jgi:hypothetical protein
MPLLSYKAGLLAVLAFIVCGFNNNGRSTDSLKNLSLLSLPLTNKKLVMAHCMTNIIRYKGHKFEDSCNPDYYSPTDNITSSIGGLTQVNVIADKYLSEASLDEAVEFEMRTAIASGIDGFQFYYTLGNDSWDDIIKAYFRVADKKNIDFKLTFCISHPSGNTQTKRIAEFARRINSIMNEAGHDNKHWMRTPDGRLIIYTWYGDGLADVPEGNSEYPAPYYVAEAFKKLGTAVNEDLACVISINEQITKEKLNSYLDYFPAVWLWTLPYTDHYIGELVAGECKKRGRVFTGSAFPDFYTSKLLKRNTWDMFHEARDAAKAGIKKTERKYIATGLSYNFRKQLEFSIDKDVPIINIITWNDYPEGHHLAPEINHNDGFSILLKYYKSEWKKEPSPYQDKNVIIAFYKKYNHRINPSPFNIPVVEIEKRGVPAELEDSIEVISILKEKCRLSVNDQQAMVASGLQSTKFTAKPGVVSITVKRNDQIIEQLICPEWITDKPYRTDRLTYSYSNQSQQFYHSIFPDDYRAISSEEYNRDAIDNKISMYGKSSLP